jgi:VIT1/CCC1 family predicted Fe2+/Mn2+ transporter
MDDVATLLAKNPADIEEMNRVFEEETQRDLKNLRSELSTAGKDALFSKILSKDVLAAVAVTMGSLASAMTFHEVGAQMGAFAVSGIGAVASIIGLLGAQNSYSKSRQEILLKHPTAYLYQF